MRWGALTAIGLDFFWTLSLGGSQVFRTKAPKSETHFLQGPLQQPSCQQNSCPPVRAASVGPEVEPLAQARVANFKWTKASQQAWQTVWSGRGWFAHEKRQGFMKCNQQHVVDHGKSGVLGVDSLSIIFNHRSFQQPVVSPGLSMVSGKESDPRKEWGRCP